MTYSEHIPVADRKWGYRPTHHVFELVFLVIACLVSVPLVLGVVPAPSSTAALLGPPLLIVWAWMLLTGSGLASVGLLWPGRIVTGLLLEQVGLIGLSGAVMLYVAGTVTDMTTTRLIPIAIVAAFGLACACRAWQLRGEIRTLVAISEQVGPTDSGEQDMRDRYQTQDEAIG